MHLISNMWFLWILATDTDDSMGHPRSLPFHVICAFLVAVAHVLPAPASPVPTAGASGAIGGIMAAYLLLHPRARIQTPFFITGNRQLVEALRRHIRLGSFEIPHRGWYRGGCTGIG